MVYGKYEKLLMLMKGIHDEASHGNLHHDEAYENCKNIQKLCKEVADVTVPWILEEHNKNMKRAMEGKEDGTDSN